MNIVTGLCLGLLIMVLGSLGMVLFGVYLANPRRAKEASIALTREEAQRLIQVIGQLQSVREKLNELLMDSTGANGSGGIPK